MGWIDRSTIPDFPEGCQPRPEAVMPDGNRSTIFQSWVRILPPETSCNRFQAHPIGTRLKEKDTNMNGPARITAFAITLAGMVLSMSGCDQLAARDQLNKGVE